MAGKRKRDILEGFDPNKSDSEDENFDPAAVAPERPRRSPKKSRSSRPKGPRKQSRRYKGSDIDDDDEELSDSEQDNSFDEIESEEEDEDLPVTSTGRKMRKAAARHASYKESSGEDEEDVVKDSDNEIEDIRTSEARPSKIVVLKTNPRAQRASKRGKEEPASHPPAHSAHAS